MLMEMVLMSPYDNLSRFEVPAYLFTTMIVMVYLTTVI